MKQYQSKNIAVQTGGEILAKADAVKAQTMTNIFASVGTAMANVEKNDRVSKAKYQASVDVAKGEMKDYDKDNWFSTKYGEVYNQTATTLAEKRYTEQIQSVVKKAHAGNIGNPSGFRMAVEGSLKGLEPKNDTLKGMFKIKASKMLEIENLAVTKEFMKKSKKEKMEALEYVRKELSMDFLSAKASGDTAKQESVISEFKKRLIDNGYAGDMLDSELYNFKLETISNEAAQQITSMVANNVPFDKLQSDILSLKGIAEDDKTDLLNSLGKRYDAVISLNNKKAKQVELSKTREQKDNYNTLISEIISGNVSINDAVEVLSTQGISYTQYSSLKKATSDENINIIDSKILQHAIAYPSTVDIQSILNSDRLSNETKEKILTKVRTLPKWTSGINYKQGLAEIYTNFKVDMNGLVVIEKGSDIEKLGKVASAYHDIMEQVALKTPDQTEAVAKKVSRAILKSFLSNASQYNQASRIKKAIQTITKETIEANPTAIQMNDFMRKF